MVVNVLVGLGCGFCVLKRFRQPFLFFEQVRNIDSGFGGLQRSGPEVRLVDEVRFSKVLERFALLLCLQIQLAEVHVYFACLDVVRAEEAHAAQQRGLVEVLRVIVLLLFYQELRHDAVDAHMERVEGPPVVVKDRQSCCEVHICLGQLVMQVVSLHEDAVELD